MVIAAASCLVFFLAFWIVVPAPSIVLLAISVLAAEESPYVALAAAVAGTASFFFARGRTRVACIALNASALAAALWPLAALPATIRESDAQLHAATRREARPGETGSGAPFELTRFFLPSAVERTITVSRDLPVPLADGTRLALDLYRPAGAGARPAVVLLFGGAWRFGSRANMAPLARELAARGYTAIAADYRLAPAHRFPAQLDDVKRALAAIAENAAAWGVDPDRVALLGESAGGELALLAAYEPEPVHVRAAIGLYPPLDLTAGYRDPPQPDPANVRSILENYLGAGPESLPAAYAAASPRAAVKPGLPPTLMIGGRRDELVNIAFQRDMASALRSQGDAVASLELPWSNHGFAALENGLGGQLAIWYAERFLAETMDEKTRTPAR